MPDWSNYYFSYGAETQSTARHQYEEWQRECVRHDRVIELMMREEEERAKDRKNYPLFYWKETCKPLLSELLEWKP